jgi:hypothetical protein
MRDLSGAGHLPEADAPEMKLAVKLVIILTVIMLRAI